MKMLKSILVITAIFAVILSTQAQSERAAKAVLTTKTVVDERGTNGTWISNFIIVGVSISDGGSGYTSAPKLWLGNGGQFDNKMMVGNGDISNGCVVSVKLFYPTNFQYDGRLYGESTFFQSPQDIRDEKQEAAMAQNIAQTKILEQKEADEATAKTVKQYGLIGAVIAIAVIVFSIIRKKSKSIENMAKHDLRVSGRIVGGLIVVLVAVLAVSSYFYLHPIQKNDAPKSASASTLQGEAAESFIKRAVENGAGVAGNCVVQVGDDGGDFAGKFTWRDADQYQTFHGKVSGSPGNWHMDEFQMTGPISN